MTLYLVTTDKFGKMVGPFFSPVSWNLPLFCLFHGLDLAPWQELDRATLDLTNI